VPSVTLRRLAQEADLLVLVNSAKDEESALRFGAIVSDRCAVSVPLVQVDAAMVLPWNDAGLQALQLAEGLGLPLLLPTSVPDEEEGWRRVGGVHTGENVWINGVVVGKAVSAAVYIRCEAGRLQARGIAVKETGVLRLGPFDAATAHVRSGVTRRTTAVPRQLPSAGGEQGRLIDHSAERAIMTCREAAYVVTVGDDTSRAAAALLYRFGVKVLALTDGDEDGICTEVLSTQGSLELRLVPGTDDVVGAEVRQALFSAGTSSITYDEMVEAIVRLAGERLLWKRERKD
ncbi:MAG: DUF2117 domain-containing protein, partial [Methanomassiliicoccales archaeon]